MFALRTDYHSAFIFIYDKTFLVVGGTSLRATGSMRLDVKNQAGTDGTIADFRDGFDFFFQVCGGLIYPRDPQVHRVLFGPNRLRVEN